MKNIINFLKKHYLALIKYGVILTATLQLLLTSVPIKAFTFTTSQVFGFYYFLFIMFGMVSIFMAFNLHKSNFARMMMILILGIAIWGGSICVFYVIDQTRNPRYAFSNVALGRFIILVGVAIYATALIGLILEIIKTSLPKKEEQQ